MLSRRRSYSLVHGFNPLEQSWICLGVGHIDDLAEGTLMSAEDTETFFGEFGLSANKWNALTL